MVGWLFGTAFVILHGGVGGLFVIWGFCRLEDWEIKTWIFLIALSLFGVCKPWRL